MPTQKRLDLTGQRFGKWTVLEFSHYDLHSLWVCICDCGTKSLQRTGGLRSGQSTQCFLCSQRQKAKKASEAAHAAGALAHLKVNQVERHGHAKKRAMTATYGSWAAMMQRCTNPKHISYGYYGGRGITICNRWLTFDNFLADMGQRPAKTTIDRIDNDGNYEPGNCRWATPKQQTKNQRKKR